MRGYLTTAAGLALIAAGAMLDSTFATTPGFIPAADSLAAIWESFCGFFRNRPAESTAAAVAAAALFATWG